MRTVRVQVATPLTSIKFIHNTLNYQFRSHYDLFDDELAGIIPNSFLTGLHAIDAFLLLVILNDL